MANDEKTAPETTVEEDVQIPDDAQIAPGPDPEEDQSADVPQTAEVIE
jgi:hypothetical protein